MRYARWGALIIALVLGGIGAAEEPETCLPLPRSDEHRVPEQQQTIIDAIKPFIGICVPVVAEGK